ncbi:AMIN domain-containing protein [Pyxidicoccus fallax]|uniref:AMIN domain-containing protein n=2 Tax=Pyxidicoccus fallax TaxID=394095 RepID=A0A848LL31_9BACT|nr:AMIN domain-containing protein [Pyxidicoccus fallax]NMO18507.1 AMIN domain-containing protein [Pyxidicoccus fallax]
MKAFAVWLLGVVLVPMVALAQAPAADLNTITGVQVNGGTVTIAGTKKPNFTTFTMTDPPRLVIDISEAVFSNVPEELQIGNGTVTGIRTASYGSDASAIARVLIGYEREVETDIQANGNNLVIRVAGGGGQAVAQAPAQPEAAPAATPTTDGSAAQAAAAAEADRQAQEKAAADAAAAARADREAQEKAAAEASAAAQADADARKRQEEEARAAAQRQEEERRAAAQASADDKKRQEEERRAAAQAAADDKKRQEEEARASAQAAADEKKRQQEEARAAAKSAADERRAQQEAAAEERRAAAQAAAEERRAEQEAAAEERRQRQAEARASRKSEAVAMNTPRESERLEVSGGASGPVEVSSRRKTMTLVGFQQQAGASRVFVRTNEPARYTVSEEGGAVVLELENTRIDLSNNTRPLDTSFFNSPVTRVEADASGRAVRVTINLRQQAPYQARQDGNVISLDFQRTGR